VSGTAEVSPQAGRARHRWLWLVPPACLLVAIAASVLAAPHLPDRMPTHWGLTGEPTTLMPRGFALAVLPALMVWSGFLVGIIGWSASSGRRESDIPAWISPAITAAVTAIVLVLHLTLLAVGLGWGVSVPAVTNLAVGALYLVLGYATRRVPPNPLFGVRTARTLACPDSWERANRIGGHWLMAAGGVTILAAPLPGGWPLAVLLGSVVVACIAALIAARDGTAPTGSSETSSTNVSG